MWAGSLNSGLMDNIMNGALPRTPWSNVCGDSAITHATLVFALLRFASTRHSAVSIKVSCYTVDMTADRNNTFRQKQTHGDEDEMVQTQEQTGQDWRKFGDR